jgi:hypothetical protein
MKNPLIQRVCLPMAEDMRFELTEACTSPPFQDGALNRSANPPTASIIIAKNSGFVTRKSDIQETIQTQETDRFRSVFSDDFFQLGQSFGEYIQSVDGRLVGAHVHARFL